MPNTSRDLFGLTVLKNNHKDIRLLRKQHGYPSHHGNKLWQSSLVLMDYLREVPLEDGSKVLEIGCGWGLAGIYCAKFQNALVTCLDIDASVFPYVQHHASLNSVTVSQQIKGYERLTSGYLKQFDVVIGGDICFWDELGVLLFNLVRRARKAGTRCIITDPGRQPFNDMAVRAIQKLDATCDAWFVPHPYNARGFILDVPAQ